MARTSRARDASGSGHPTRRHLVEETSRQIFSVGIEAVDVDEVLANVGVTKGSLYHHFGSVDDLMVAGLLHAFEGAIRESEEWSLSMRDECRSAREARDRLRDLVERSQAPERWPIRSIRLHALSMARTHPGIREEVARLQAGLTDTMTEIHREFQVRGWTRTDADPRALAVLLQAMNMGRIVDDVVRPEDRVDPAAWIALYSDVLDRFFIVD